MKKILNNPIVVTVLVLISIGMVYMNIRSIWSDDDLSSGGGSSSGSSSEEHYIEEYEDEEQPTVLVKGAANALHEYRWEISSERNPFLLGKSRAPIIKIDKSPTLELMKTPVFRSYKKRTGEAVKKPTPQPIPRIVDKKIQAILHGAGGPLVLIEKQKIRIGDIYRDGTVESIDHDSFVVVRAKNKVRYVIDSLGGNR